MKKLYSKILQYSFIKYAIVGVMNTIVGLGIIFALIRWGKVWVEVANIIGYAVGFLLSYILNKYFTFKSTNAHKHDFKRFAISMGIAYVINFVVLVIMHRYYHSNGYFATIIGAIFYTISGYLLSKFYAFRQDKSYNHAAQEQN